ncbi:MAG: peptide deformylase [Patescibacteria group bacterium]|nr:MAG: peptide deformylase [Patescibacteria group bacterium]
MKEIIQKEHEVLREQSKAVPLGDITSAKIKKVLKDMKEAMDSQDDGVAIAAPQIGVSLRIFIVSKKVFERHGNKDGQQREKQIVKDLVFINPEIVKHSKKTAWVDEGCLSVRWLYGEVERAEQLTIKAYDEDGNVFTRGAGGLLAQIFQHETDHLDGTLFIDKARNVQEVLPDEHHAEDTPACASPHADRPQL